MGRILMPDSDNRLAKKVSRIGVVGRAESPNADDAVRDVLAWLKNRDIQILFESGTASRIKSPLEQTYTREELPIHVDLLLVLGGDGTLLSIAHPVASYDCDTPILAVNCGSLGFLTEITRPEMFDVLDSTLNGMATLDERRMFRAKVVRGSDVIAERFVLNDVVIGKSSRSPIVDLSISVRGHFVISSRADGVILSTPTGSTAYNLAAGGPIVHPTVDAVVITPIAPHTLTNRPIVLCDDAPIVVTPDLSDDHLEITASFDGQLSVKLKNGDIVVVERAKNPLRVIRSRSRNYFAVLREKLKWGER